MWKVSRLQLWWSDDDPLPASECKSEFVVLMKYRFLLLALCAMVSKPAIGGETSEAREIFRSFSECTVHWHPKEAAAVVLSDGSSDDILRAHPKLFTGDCLAFGELRIPGGDYARYGLAEALVRREYSKGLPVDIGRAAPLAHPAVNASDYQPKAGKKPRPKELAKLQKQKDHDVAERVLSIYGECVARIDPRAAYRLVLTKPSSKGEREAYAAMRAGLSSCLAPGGKMTFSKSVLRGTIALNLYRLAKAPRLAAAASPTH